MTLQRIKELRRIARQLYLTVLDEMGTHKWGHIEGGTEETFVLAELSTQINLEMTNWLCEDLTKGDDTDD